MHFKGSLWIYSHPYEHEIIFLQYNSQLDQVSFLFNTEWEVLSKELEKTSTKFSAKYRVLTQLLMLSINTIYFISLREKEKK